MRIIIIAIALTIVASAFAAAQTTTTLPATCSAPLALNATHGTGIYSGVTIDTSVSPPMLYVPNNDKKLHAINAETLAQVWASNAAVYTIKNTPALFNDLVIVGGGGAFVFAYNKATGASVWSYPTADFIQYSSPHVRDGFVYIGCFSNDFYKINATDGTLGWSVSTGNGNSQVNSCPTTNAAGTSVFVGSRSDEIFSYAVSNGAQNWAYDTGTDVDGRLLVVEIDGLDHVFCGANNGMYAVSQSNGTLHWSYATGIITGGVAYHDGKIFFGANDNTFYALVASTGALAWNMAEGSSFSFAIPVIKDGVIWIGNSNSYLYALSAADGTTMMTHNVQHIIYATVAITNCIVYVGTAASTKNVRMLNLTDGGCAYTCGVPPITTTLSTLSTTSTSAPSTTTTPTTTTPTTTTPTTTATNTTATSTTATSTTAPSTATNTTDAPGPTTTAAPTTSGPSTTSQTTQSTATTTAGPTTTYTTPSAGGPTTTLPTGLATLHTYVPLGATNPTVFTPSATAPAATGFVQVNSETTIAGVAAVIASSSIAAPPLVALIQSATPQLGSFIMRPAFLPNCGGCVKISVGIDKSSVLLSSNNATALSIAIRQAFVFNVAPIAEARNLTHLAYTELKLYDSGTAPTGVAAIPLKEFLLNEGPQQLAANSTSYFNVTRGINFVLEMQQLFEHRQYLPMSFTAALSNGFPLPSNIRVTCDEQGACTARGKIDSTAALSLEVYASDQYRLGTTIAVITPIYRDLTLRAGATMKTIQLRPGKLNSFETSLPAASTLFDSSTPVSWSSLRQVGGYPLPSTLVFDLPGTLRGYVAMPGILVLEATAADYFQTLVINVTLNFTNIEPVCDSSSNANNTASRIEPVFALHQFTRHVQLSHICTDGDSDPLEYTVERASTPSWLIFSVRPGGFAYPQSLTLLGTPPASTLDTTIALNLTVSDGFSSTRLTLSVVVAPNSAPVLIKPLPNITVAPGATSVATVVLSRHFSDSQGDKLTAEATPVNEKAKKWIKAEVQASDTELVVTATPPEESPETGEIPAENDERVDVTVRDPFGASVKVPLVVRVRLTTWQQVRAAVVWAAASCSAIVGILSIWYFFPTLYNLFRSGSKTIPCPLTQKEPEYFYPADTCTVELSFRPAVGAATSCAVKTFGACSEDLRDRLSAVPMPVGDPGRFITKNPDSLALNIQPELDPETGKVRPKPPPAFETLLVRIYSRHGFLTVRFEVSFDEITKDWVFSEEQIAAASMPGASAAAASSSSLSPGGSEVAQLRRHVAAQDVEMKSMTVEVTSMRSLLQSLLDGKAPPPSSSVKMTNHDLAQNDSFNPMTPADPPRATSIDVPPPRAVAPVAGFQVPKGNVAQHFLDDDL